MSNCNPIHDRRAHRRLLIHHPAKVYDPRAGRYRPAMTRDTSTHGMMLELIGEVRFASGDPVAIAVDWHESRPLIPHGDLIPATVVRVDATEGGACRIAVRFSYPQPLAAAA